MSAIWKSKGYFETPQEVIPHATDNIKKSLPPKVGDWIIQEDANGVPCLYRKFEANKPGAMYGLELIAQGSDEIAELYLALDDCINLTGE